MKEISIITKDKVVKNRQGKDLFLKRKLTRTLKENGKKTYTTVFIYVDEEDYQWPKFDENGEKQFDEDNELITETLTRLVEVAQKDEEDHDAYNYEQIDGFYGFVKEYVPLGDSYIEFENNLEQFQLLYTTQQEQPFGIASNQWVNYEHTL